MIVKTTPSIYGRFDRWRIVRSMFGVPDQLSLATWVAHDEDRITRFTNWLQNTLDPNAIKSIKSDWGFWARGSQFPPNDDWDVWLISAGRGFGKTRVGAEMVNHWAESVPGCMILMVGRTSEEVRDVMVYGISGVIRVARDNFRPVYEPSQTRLRWPNGSLAYTFSADVPDSLRGRNANFAWGDEVASWSKDRETFDNLMKCLRVGEHPQVLLTTTPKAGSYVVRRIMDLAYDLREMEGLMTKEELERRHYARGGRVLEAAPELRCITTVGNSYENLQNMSASYINILKTYEGTSDAQSEIHGIIPTSDPEALWTPEIIHHVNELPRDQHIRLIAIGIDPSGSTTGTCGIVAAALMDESWHAYVIVDGSLSGTPGDWSKMCIEIYQKFESVAPTYLICEQNYGGAMVREVLQQAATEYGIQPMIVEVVARQSKLGRAHPVATLYQQGKVFHVGNFPSLETEMTTFGGRPGEKSPNRMDAMVHAVGHLLLGGVKGYHRPGGYALY